MFTFSWFSWQVAVQQVCVCVCVCVCVWECVSMNKRPPAGWRQSADNKLPHVPVSVSQQDQTCWRCFMFLSPEHTETPTSVHDMLRVEPTWSFYLTRALISESTGRYVLARPKFRLVYFWRVNYMLLWQSVHMRQVLSIPVLCVLHVAFYFIKRKVPSANEGVFRAPLFHR